MMSPKTDDPRSPKVETHGHELLATVWRNSMIGAFNDRLPALLPGILYRRLSITIAG
jgi:hypothetical protein